MTLLIFKSLLSLGIILLLILGLTMFFKKFFLRSKKDKNSLVDVDVIGIKHLQPKKSVYVLKVLNTISVVGISETGIQPIAQIKDVQVVNEIEAKMAVEQLASTWLEKKIELHSSENKGFIPYLYNLMKGTYKKSGNVTNKNYGNDDED